MRTLTVGPSYGSLVLRTGVEGRLARLGHDLLLGLSDWEAVAELDGERPVSVRLRAGLASLQVLEGTGGVKPLSDGDRRTIRDNALEALGAAQHPDVVFTSTGVRAVDGGAELDGDLSVRGVARPVVVPVRVAGSGPWEVTALVPVVQTAHGVAPYRAMAGGLRVRDRVDVALSVTVPPP